MELVLKVEANCSSSTLYDFFLLFETVKNLLLFKNALVNEKSDLERERERGKALGFIIRHYLNQKYLL